MHRNIQIAKFVKERAGSGGNGNGLDKKIARSTALSKAACPLLLLSLTSRISPPGSNVTR
jgi:hypothetical protein